MQVVFKNERNNSKGADAVGIDACLRRNCRCLEGKYDERFRSRSIRV